MVSGLIQSAAKRLKASDTPQLDARVLLAAAMGIDNAAMIFRTPDVKELDLFESYIEKRLNGVPVAYILGEKEFMGLSFRLNQATLIPRPDTECLVERVIEKNTFSAPKILDLCTGSGCIGISLARMLSNAFCDLTDISGEALDIAAENAVLNGVSDITNTFRLNVLRDDFPAGYDIIVSNPPYIETKTVRTLEVSKFEPVCALDGGVDGLDFYRVISKKAYAALKSGGMLALEIGYDQRESVSSLLCDFSSVEVFRDYGGNDRVIIAIK